ncbi:MAG: tetratricopeptide repeat protein [Bacteroidales bacterium]|jgi:tetratricopeptide (TPR) repeat protein|nr:tetratricopeptide repeat protein [Bacteroidales bacterium]
MKQIIKYLIPFIFIALLYSCATQKKDIPKVYTQEELKIDGLFLDGATQREIGNYNKANELFDEVIKMNPSYSAAYFEKANIAYIRGNVKDAITLTQKAVELEPENIWYNSQLAEIYMNIEDYEKAAQSYEKLIPLSKDPLELYKGLIQIYVRLNDEESIKKTYNIMKQKWGEQKDILFILAEINMNKSNYKKALQYYKQVESYDSKDPYIYISLANYYLTMNSPDSTYIYLEKAFENPNLDFHTKIQVLLMIYQKSVDSNEKDFRRFFSLLEQLSVLYPNERIIWELLSTGYMKVSAFDKAVSSVRKAIQINQEENNNQSLTYETYQNYLFALSTLEMTDTIIDVAQKIIALYPTQPIPYLFLGVNYYLKKNYPKAKEALLDGEKFVASFHGDLLEDFYINLAEVYYKLGDNNSAFSYYDKLLKINPNNYSALNNYAYYLSLLEIDLDKAETMAKKAYLSNTTSTTFVDTYAWVLFKMKKYRDAYDIMQNIINQKESWSDVVKEHYEEILKAINN